MNTPSVAYFTTRKSRKGRGAIRRNQKRQRRPSKSVLARKFGAARLAELRNKVVDDSKSKLLTDVTVTGREQYIQSLYGKYLRRIPSQNEISEWSKRDLTLEELDSYFYNSSERVEKFPNMKRDGTMTPFTLNYKGDALVGGGGGGALPDPYKYGGEAVDITGGRITELTGTGVGAGRKDVVETNNSGTITLPSDKAGIGKWLLLAAGGTLIYQKFFSKKKKKK